jgi:hypothetical protein
MMAMEVTLTLTNPTTGDKYNSIRAKVIPKFPAINAVDWRTIQGKFPHLGATKTPSPAPDKRCHLLLGNNNAHLTSSIAKDITANIADQPTAKTTRLGITIGGPTFPPHAQPLTQQLLLEATDREKHRLSEQSHLAATSAY